VPGHGSPRITPPILDIARERPTLGFEHMHEGVERQRFDSMQLLAPRAFDLLDGSHPVRPFIHRLARGKPSQQVALAIAPQQDRTYPSTIAMSGAAGFFMPTIW
jgi:hypothetical protein